MSGLFIPFAEIVADTPEVEPTTLSPNVLPDEKLPSTILTLAVVELANPTRASAFDVVPMMISLLVNVFNPVVIVRVVNALKVFVEYVFVVLSL